MATVTPTKLITAEEYLLMPGLPERSELVRGVIVVMNLPGFRHGEVCSTVHHYVDNFVRQQQIGRTLTNDSGIITERNPDTVRGPDISYYSYERVAKGQSPRGYAGAPPEIVFEIVSPYNTRKEIRTKTAEYLSAGVNVVCVVDSDYKTVNVYYPDLPVATLQGDDALTFDELPGFSVPVSKFFE